MGQRRRHCGRGLVVAAATLFVAMVAACDTPRRIPRIEPDLRNWAEPYVGLAGIRIHVFNTGAVRVPTALAYRGGSWFSTRELEITACVIEHPRAGLIVFDTGLSPRIATDPKRYLGWMSLVVGAFTMSEGQELPAQMRAAGFDPNAVSYVVLSHLHFDHAGTVEAFRNATVVVAHDEKPEHGRASWHEAALFRIEDYDDVDDWFEIDFDSKEPYATFFAHHDLVGDGSIQLVDLRGHTAGSLGMIVNAAEAPVLLTGDAAWVEENWRYGSTPLIAHDSRLLWEQIWRIKKFAQLVPSVIVVPGHDTRGLVRAEQSTVTVHAFETR